MPTVILAKGRFPTHPVPLALLHNAKQIVCCDGAVEQLLEHGLEPTAIVGDLDSISPVHKKQFAQKLHFNPDQENNDLTKSVLWCKQQGIMEFSILAGTGRRDDHTIGNVSLLPSYARQGLKVEMVTDYGVFRPLLSSRRLKSFSGQQVSIFSFNNQTHITSTNLKFPLNSLNLPEWWMGTLNQSLGDWFELQFEHGPIIVYQTHE